MTVLGIGAHPDDLEIYCFGTLAKFVKNGHAVFTSSVANGNKGHYQIMPDELAAIRCKETSEAAKLIGAEYIAIGADDMGVDSHNQKQRDAVTDLIRRVKPDLIITHGPNDYMSDHVETSRLVFYSAFASSLPHYFTALPFHDAVVPIYYMENSQGLNFQPEEFVDITEQFALKIKAIECHASQLAWLTEHDSFDMRDGARIMAEFRGMECGVKYAESFAQCKTWPRVLPKRLLP